MTQDEKDKLLALFDGKQRWCQEAEARDVDGNPVRYDDADAVAWDIVGGMCHLFGWDRACKLFMQVTKITGPKRYWESQSRSMVAMASLTDFNDEPETTYAQILDMLQEMPVRG